MTEHSIAGADTRSANRLELGGVELTRALPALRKLEPGARACWVHDLDAVAAAATRFRAAFSGLDPLAAFAIKANALPAVLETIYAAGIGAEAGSIGELELARALGVPAERRLLNGNGRTPEEAEWCTKHGVHSINADHVGELDLLDRAAATAGRTLRVALRVNPGIRTTGHPYVATGHEEAKFGIGPDEALAAWSARARWPNLRVDGAHVHVGSQIVETEPLEQAAELAFALADESAARGAPLGFINLGGGFGVDYLGGAGFPLETYGEWLVERARGREIDWVLEPGRWLVATSSVLLAEVLWVKNRNGRRFIVLAAGLNDLLRPALYGARHRIVPLVPRPGALESAMVVGPVCESADVFEADAMLPPLEAGDTVALLDAGAYGSTMSSNYNGRPRLAELVASQGKLRRAARGETPEVLLARRTDDALS